MYICIYVYVYMYTCMKVHTRIYMTRVNIGIHRVAISLYRGLLYTICGNCYRVMTRNMIHDTYQSRPTYIKCIIVY